MIRRELIGRKFKNSNPRDGIIYTITGFKDDRYLLKWNSPRLNGREDVSYSSASDTHRYIDNHQWVLLPEDKTNEIKKDMIDYRIPGTKIPTLNGMEYGIIHWKEQSFQCSTNKFDGFISYGAINYGGFECIKIEKPNYTRETLLFIVKLKDLQALEAKPASSDNYTYIDPSMLTSLPTDTVIVVTYHSGKVYLNKIARLGSAELKCYIKQDGTRLERGGMTSTDCESLRYATPEEEHWVNMCDSLNRFIPKGEALNSFVPKAVPIEKVIEKIVTVNGYSIEQIEAALNDIPWLEDDDAKELTNELSLRLTKNIAPTKKDLSTIGIQKKPYEFPKIDLPF